MHFLEKEGSNEVMGRVFLECKTISKCYAKLPNGFLLMNSDLWKSNAETVVYKPCFEKKYQM